MDPGNVVVACLHLKLQQAAIVNEHAFSFVRESNILHYELNKDEARIPSC